MAAGTPLVSTDLAMTRYNGTPSRAPLDAADSWGTLDLKLAPGMIGTRASGKDDIGTVAGRANLAQALVLRLLTLQGSLAPLGHPDYGCRLVTLVGETSNETTRHLARLYVIEAVRQERRVKTLTSLIVEPVPGFPETLRITLAVEPLHGGDPLSLTFELAL